MKLESIKKHLSPYSIYQKRHTTIAHAFASALAPVDVYDESKLLSALKNLGQDDADNIFCVYCRKSAQTWDHLLCLVKNGELNGYGHQIGNLVPSCKDCNSKKGSKNYQKFILENVTGDEDYKHNLISKLDAHLRLAQPFKTDLTDVKIKLAELKEIKEKIFSLMKEADGVVLEIKHKL